MSEPLGSACSIFVTLGHGVLGSLRVAEAAAAAGAGAKQGGPVAWLLNRLNWDTSEWWLIVISGDE